MQLYLSHFVGAAMVDVTFKALLAVAIAGFVVTMLRRTTASTRHAIWLTATVMLVTLAICYGLCAFAVGIGARYPMFDQTNSARIATGSGSAVRFRSRP